MKPVAIAISVICAVSLCSCSLKRNDFSNAEVDSTQPTAIVTTPVAPEQNFHSFPLITASTVQKASTSDAPLPVWRHYHLPGKQATRYTYKRLDGRHAVSASSTSAASMLRQAVRLGPEKLGKLQFSWKVSQLVKGADLGRRETHDSPVRVMLVFEGDRSTFSAKNSMLSELARAVTGEELPYATLMYVWCNTSKRGSVINSPRTDRIREIVMESGSGRVDQWLDYSRDVQADFRLAFGEAPGALLEVGIMTDTDNTRQNATAWYGPISITPEP